MRRRSAYQNPTPSLKRDPISLDAKEHKRMKTDENGETHKSTYVELARYKGRWVFEEQVPKVEQRA